MGRLQFILIFLVQYFSALGLVAYELAIIAGVVACIHFAYCEIGLTHFIFFQPYVKSSSVPFMGWVLILGMTCFSVIFYENQ